MNIQGESTLPQEMRNNGIACNTITYNTMLDACAKCGCMEKASMLLEDMRETSIDPDIITYSTIIKGYCLAGDPVTPWQKDFGRFHHLAVMGLTSNVVLM